MAVTALNMNIVCEESGHKVVPNGPNTCITPGVAAGAPGPMVYVLTASSSTLKKGTDKTDTGGKKILNAKGKVKSCNGNEPGTQKDIVSFKTTSTSFPFPIPCITIHFEGAPVSITGNTGMGNSM